MLLAILLSLPATGWSQDAAVRGADPKPVPPASFSISSEKIREILRARAHEQATATEGEASKPAMSKLLALTFASDARVDHVECDALNCYERAKDGRILRTTSRDRNFGQVPGRSGSDAWLSCQDTDNMLSTFERYDNCRGMGVAFSHAGNGGPNGVNAPPRR
jgi:hypothetical protein